MRPALLALSLTACIYRVDPPFDGGPPTPPDGSPTCRDGEGLCEAEPGLGGWHCESLREWARCGACDVRCADGEECWYGSCRPAVEE